MKIVGKIATLLGLMLVLTSYAQAGVQRLAKMDRSDNSETSTIYVETTEANDLNKLKVVFSDGEQISATLSELEGRGKVMLSVKGQKAIVLKSVDVNLYTGGTIVLNYLYKFKLTGSERREYRFTIERDGDQWSLKRNGRKFTRMSADVGPWGINKIDFK